MSEWAKKWGFDMLVSVSEMLQKKCKTKKEHDSHASRTLSTSWLLVVKSQVDVATTTTTGPLLLTMTDSCLCAL